MKFYDLFTAHWKNTSANSIDWTLSFLSRDAMRKRGLCCQPLSIRLSVRQSRSCIVPEGYRYRETSCSARYSPIVFWPRKPEPFLYQSWTPSWFLVHPYVKDALGDTIPPAPPVLRSLFNLVPAGAHFAEIFLDDIFPVLSRLTWPPPETLGFPCESLSRKSMVIHSWKMSKPSQTSASDNVF